MSVLIMTGHCGHLIEWQLKMADQTQSVAEEECRPGLIQHPQPLLRAPLAFPVGDGERKALAS